MSTVMPTFGVRQRNLMSARQLDSPVPPMAAQMLTRADAEAAAPYEGITLDGTHWRACFRCTRRVFRRNPCGQRHNASSRT